MVACIPSTKTRRLRRICPATWNSAHNQQRDRANQIIIRRVPHWTPINVMVLKIRNFHDFNQIIVR